MTSLSGTEAAEPHPSAATSAVDDTSTAPSGSTKAKGPRKRTKTGCLTCRKRRIKCGEEKPRCNNCIKSKRDCEGYGQRVVFRPPVGPIPHLDPITPAQSLPGTGHTFLNRQFVQSFHHGEPAGARPFLPLAPRPSPYGHIADAFVRHEFAHPSMGSQPIPEDGHYSSWEAIQYTQPAQSSLHNLSQGGQDSTIYLPSHHPGAGYDNPAALQQTDSYQFHQPQAVHHSQFSTSFYVDDASLSVNESGQYNRHYIPPEPGIAFDSNREPQQHVAATDPEMDVGDSDDYYDVDTDEEMEGEEAKFSSMPYGQSTKMVPYQMMSRVGQYSAFNNFENILATYRPSPLTSPLLDPHASQIFQHFLTVVGPAVSIFERHPFTPSVSMSAGSLPPEQQSLWAHTLPTMALEHPGLLQAMLAFSSLNIASMTNQPLTICFRHYHYALRKVGKAVGLPNRRKQIPTLAATLLLGYFEVMAAEHTKWNSHLAGAMHLIRETDFATMTRDIRAMRARARMEQWQPQSQDPWMGPTAPYLGSYFENDIFAPHEFDIDTTLINTLTGRAINYDEFGQVYGSPTKKPKRELTAKDVDDYRVRCDLYWWYAKQDVFHSIISGHALLLPYERWGGCPPRAGVGKLDAAYGSMDHLILLLARIATFTFKDRKRKLKVIESNGGEWRPPPNFFPPGMGGPPGPHPPRGPPPGVPQTPTGPPRRPPPNMTKRESSPPMYGMVPPPGPIQLPSAFKSVYPSPPSPSGSEGSVDLDSRTADAEVEWREIVHACDEFERALSTPGFVPLPPDGAPFIASPFGPALQYRTHVVACIWAFYYTARIIIERAHPAMPPAAMVAAGVAAPRTAQYAQLIGRVAAGVHHTHQQFGIDNMASLNPTTVGVLSELMLPLFFSGVQYVDPAQREWTITKLREIARVTGGTSPTAVAAGCETSWVKAYEIGRGPPYQRQVIPSQAQNRQGNISETREDRRFVTVPEGAKLSFAMGLLSLDNQDRD